MLTDGHRCLSGSTADLCWGHTSCGLLPANDLGRVPSEAHLQEIQDSSHRQLCFKESPPAWPNPPQSRAAETLPTQTFLPSSLPPSVPPSLLPSFLYWGQAGIAVWRRPCSPHRYCPHKSLIRLVVSWSLSRRIQNNTLVSIATAITRGNNRLRT